MRLAFIPQLIRELSGRGALDNVSAVIAERDAVNARLDALAVRVTVGVPVLVADAA